jgi:hypothetical protein
VKCNACQEALLQQDVKIVKQSLINTHYQVELGNEITAFLNTHYQVELGNEITAFFAR